MIEIGTIAIIDRRMTDNTLQFYLNRIGQLMLLIALSVIGHLIT